MAKRYDQCMQAIPLDKDGNNHRDTSQLTKINMTVICQMIESLVTKVPIPSLAEWSSYSQFCANLIKRIGLQ